MDQANKIIPTNLLARRELLARGLVLGTIPLLSVSKSVAATPPPTLPSAIPTDPYLNLVHPELRGVGARLLEMYRAQPPLSRETLARERQGAARYEMPPLPNVPWSVRTVPGPRGAPDVTIYVINARPSGAPRPAILHMHGGGFVIGSPKASIAQLQELCRELDCVAVSVDYRLAPETTFRGSVEDNYAALRWLHAHAGELGGDPARIAVMGESAGGGHAAMLAIAARDRGEVPIAFQCLVYPMLDDRTGSTRTAPPHVGRIGWNPQRNRFGWESLLGMVPGGRRVPRAAVPARQERLEGLPPGFIGVGSIDLFADEDMEYAARLNHAGVATELIVVPGAFHGFDNPRLGSQVGRWFTVAKIEALRRGLSLPDSPDVPVS